MAHRRSYGTPAFGHDRRTLEGRFPRLAGIQRLGNELGWAAETWPAGRETMTIEPNREPFASMSPEERARYGPPEEWQDEGYVPPRNRAPETAQFSIRLPRTEFLALR